MPCRVPNRVPKRPLRGQLSAPERTSDTPQSRAHCSRRACKAVYTGSIPVGAFALRGRLRRESPLEPPDRQVDPGRRRRARRQAPRTRPRRRSPATGRRATIRAWLSPEQPAPAPSPAARRARLPRSPHLAAAQPGARARRHWTKRHCARRKREQRVRYVEDDGTVVDTSKRSDEWLRSHRRHVREFGARVRAERLQKVRRAGPAVAVRSRTRTRERRPGATRRTASSSTTSGNDPSGDSDGPGEPAAALLRVSCATSTTRRQPGTWHCSPTRSGPNRADLGTRSGHAHHPDPAPPRRERRARARWGRGADRNRTGVHGFAGRCVATPPRRRGAVILGPSPVALLRLRLPGRLAQLGERRLDKAEVTGSSPVSPMSKGPHSGPFVFLAGTGKAPARASWRRWRRTRPPAWREADEPAGVLALAPGQEP